MRNMQLSTLFLIAITLQYSAARTCYECSSTIDSNGLESSYPTGSSCAKVTGLKPVDAPAGCMSRFQSSEGYTTISRSGVSVTDTNYCTTTSANSLTTTCYCNNTDNCNSQPVAVPTSLDCYECQSSAYFDNGCGSTVNPESVYVKTVRGCSACYKTVADSQDRILTYTRGCTRNIAIDESCVNTDAGQVAKKCSCATSLCNSVEITTAKSVSTLAAVIISAVFKMFY